MRESRYEANQNVNRVVIETKKDNALKERIERIQNSKSYDRETYEKGTEWALEGRDLDEAGELSNNKDFLNGFARGLRLIKAELDKTSTTNSKTR